MTNANGSIIIIVRRPRHGRFERAARWEKKRETFCALEIDLVKNKFVLPPLGGLRDSVSQTYGIQRYCN
jgi:hypothetical protein